MFKGISISISASAIIPKRQIFTRGHISTLLKLHKLILIQGITPLILLVAHISIDIHRNQKMDVGAHTVNTGLGIVTNTADEKANQDFTFIKASFSCPIEKLVLSPP